MTHVSKAYDSSAPDPDQVEHFLRNMDTGFQCDEFRTKWAEFFKNTELEKLEGVRVIKEWLLSIVPDKVHICDRGFIYSTENDDAPTKITQKGRKKANELSKSAVQETKDKAIKSEKIIVRFLNGDTACTFDRGVTSTEIRVAVAKKLNIFAPQVKIYGHSTGDLVFRYMEELHIPPIVTAVIDPNLLFDERTWDEALQLHGDAADVEGVRRAVAALGVRLPQRKFLLTKVFFREIGYTLKPCLETFLQVGVYVNARFPGIGNGNSSLAKACELGNLELVKRLLAAGANVHLKNDYGCTCLMAASSHGHIEIVECLLEAGSNLEDKNVFGETCLDRTWIPRKRQLDVVKRLLDAGAYPNEKFTDSLLRYMEDHFKPVSLSLNNKCPDKTTIKICINIIRRTLTK